jgi:hypothetical protein
VRRDGETIATLDAEVGRDLQIKAPIDHAGPNVVELEVAAVKDEITDRNRKAVVAIEGVRDKLRVLLVSGEPHQGERMWRNLLKSDANVDLVHFTILRPPEKASDGTPINELSLIAFPVADLFGRKIKDFDLIIFDRYSSQAILPRFYLDNVVAYVRQGGALLMAEGPAYGTPDGLFATPLGAIAPARPTGEEFDQPFRAEISPDGAKHPVTRGLVGGDANPPAWGRWLRQIGGEPTGGATLMQGVGDSPLLVLNRVDKGRVALLLSRPDVAVGARLRRRRPLSRPAAPARPLADEGARPRGGGAALARQRPRPDGRAPEPEGRDPAGDGDRAGRQDDERAALVRRAGPVARDLSVDEDGLYRASDGEHIALAVVGPQNPVEFQDVVSTPEKLKAARRGDRRRRPSPGARRRRRDHAAARRRDAALAELFRRRLHRRQARRRERADRRQADAARRRLPRPGAAARRAGVGVAARRRRAPVSGQNPTLGARRTGRQAALCRSSSGDCEQAWRPSADRCATFLTFIGLRWVSVWSRFPIRILLTAPVQTLSSAPVTSCGPIYSAPIRGPDSAAVDTMSVSMPLAR